MKVLISGCRLVTVWSNQVKLFPDPRHLREAKKKQYDVFNMLSKNALQTQTPSFQDEGTEVDTLSMLNGHREECSKKLYLVWTEGASHLYATFHHLPRNSLQWQQSNQYHLGMESSLFVCNLVLCQPPSKIFKGKWKSSWLPDTHTDAAVASLFSPAFYLGYREINFRKVLRNKRDLEIETSGEEDQNFYQYYSIERIK